MTVGLAMAGKHFPVLYENISPTDRVICSEICSAHPTSGGPYFWAAMLSRPKDAPLASWITGWFNLLGQVAVTTGIRCVNRGYSVSRVLTKLRITVSPARISSQRCPHSGRALLPTRRLPLVSMPPFWLRRVGTHPRILFKVLTPCVCDRRSHQHVWRPPSAISQ